MQTRDEIIYTMDVEQRVCKLETLLTLLVEYINRYNINDAVNANHLQLFSLSRDEALHRLSRGEFGRFWNYRNFRLCLILLLLLGQRVARCWEAATVKTARHAFCVDLVLRGCSC